MANLTSILKTAERAISMLAMLAPALGETAPLVVQITGVLSKVLAGAAAGAKGYDALVDELEELIGEMEAIRAKGGVSGADFRAEVEAINARGERLDALLTRLKG